MIFESMSLICADNSGAKILKCIQVLGGSYKIKERVGHFVKIIAKKINHLKKIKKKKMYLGLPIVTKSKVKRFDGLFVGSQTSRVLIFSDAYKFQGTRIYGYIFKELQLNLLLKLKVPKIIKYNNIQL